MGKKGDPANDPTLRWDDEDNRPTTQLGKISIEAILPEATCDAGTFLPGNVTDRIAGPADDPIFAARSPAYIVSFIRRKHSHCFLSPHSAPVPRLTPEFRPRATYVGKGILNSRQRSPTFVPLAALASRPSSGHDDDFTAASTPSKVEIEPSPPSKIGAG